MADLKPGDTVKCLSRIWSNRHAVHDVVSGTYGRVVRIREAGEFSILVADVDFERWGVVDYERVKLRPMRGAVAVSALELVRSGEP